MRFVNTSSVYALGIIFPILGLLAIAARFLARRRRGIDCSWDDWLTIPAQVFTTACGAILVAGAATRTIGSHNAPATAVAALTIDNPKQTLFLKLEVAFLLLSYLAIGFIRLVFLFLFRRIFRGRFFTISNWCLIGVVCAWTLSFFIGYFTSCGKDLNTYWGPLIAVKQSCAGTFILLSVMCVTDFVVDVCVLCLPLICIWQLKVKTNTKLGVSLIFLLGIFSVASSCVRMVCMLQILAYPFGTEQRLFDTAGTSDSMGVISVIIWFTMLEIGVGVITMNLPVLPGLVRGLAAIGCLRRALARLTSALHLRQSGRHYDLEASNATSPRRKLPQSHDAWLAHPSEAYEEKNNNNNTVRVTTTVNVTESAGRTHTFEDMLSDPTPR